MNGSKAFLKMRQIDPKSKVIIASGFTKDESIEELREQGLSGFIRKPYSNDELNQILHKVLG